MVILAQETFLTHLLRLQTRDQVVVELLVLAHPMLVRAVQAALAS
jgi:hypothetical protein